MKPVICNYYLTYRCNARCGFCSIWQDTSIPASRESPVGVVCRNLGDARMLGVKVVDLTGGEPLLYDGLPDVLAHARKIGLWTTVTTNGILYPRRARELAGLVSILQFSLDAPDRAGHDAVKGVPCFDRLMESIESARSLGERPTFIHTVTDENIEAVPGVIALARKVAVPLFLNPCFAYADKVGLSRENARFLGKLVRGRGVTIDRGYLRFLMDGGNRRDNPRCLAVSSTIVISPDDRMLLPCFHFMTRSIPIGGRLVAIRQSQPVAIERHHEGSYPSCEGCAVNCYIRASLYRRFDRYFLPSIFSAAKYLLEYYRSPRK